MKKIYPVLIFLFLISRTRAEDGYRLWLRYDLINNKELLQQYRILISSVYATDEPSVKTAKKELLTGLEGLLGKKITLLKQAQGAGLILEKSGGNTVRKNISTALLEKAGQEGFIIKTINTGNAAPLLITANTDAGLLYGVFHFLRLLETHQKINKLHIDQSPPALLRLLNQ